jgi:hypothetical protein
VRPLRLHPSRPRQNYRRRRFEYREELWEASEEQSRKAARLLESAGHKGLDFLDSRARINSVGQERPARVSLSRTTDGSLAPQQTGEGP